MKPKLTWSRRLCKIVAVFLILGGVALLLHRLFLYPHTFPGKFDRIHLGMAEADVLELLGPAAARPTPWSAHHRPGHVVRTLVYYQQDGREKIDVLRGDEAEKVVNELNNLQMFGPRIPRIPSRILDEETPPHFYTNNTTDPLRWGNRNAWIYLELDAERRVVVKHWVEFQSSTNSFRRFLARLGL